MSAPRRRRACPGSRPSANRGTRPRSARAATLSRWTTARERPWRSCPRRRPPAAGSEVAFGSSPRHCSTRERCRRGRRTDP